jgi:Holliday junction resolvasome RuvABC endonuclease subunit
MVNHLFSFHRPAFVAYEKVQRHVGTYAAHAYGAYQGMLLTLAYEHCIPVVTMSVGEIKKFITGKGNADKQMVIDAVNKRGHNITDDNEADAVAMLYLQLSLMEK